MKTLTFNQLNESEEPNPKSGSNISTKEFNLLRDSKAATTKDAGHFHMVNKDDTNTSTQYNIVGGNEFHLHDIKNGKVLPAGHDDHIHTI